MTDPLKKIELFKALASPAYIVASLENSNEVSSDFFCPVKTCFEFACEANFRKSTIPEYKREYAEIESRWAFIRASNEGSRIFHKGMGGLVDIDS